MKGLHMKNPKTLIATLIITTGAALFLGGCINSVQENVIDPAFKDAKVDARVGGQSLSGNFQQGKDWNNTMTTPTGLQAFSNLFTKVGGLKKQSALPKQSSLDIGAAVKMDYSDTAKGIFRITSETKLLLTTMEDTVVGKWDDNARDNIGDNEHIISWKRVSTSIGGKIETASFTDGDKDGIITPTPGMDNRVRINLISSENGTMEKTFLLVGAGPDANFDNDSDNTVIEATWTKTKDLVVVGQGAYLDGDGDGVVTDNSKTCVVEAKYSEINPKDRPLVKKVTFNAKVRVFANKAGDEPLTFSYVEEMLSGRINAVTIKNRAGGPEFVKGDTMTVRLATMVTDDKDTLRSAVIEFIMNPGLDLKSDSDDSCYAIHITTEKKFGFERSTEFNFISKSAIPHGQNPTEGTFDGKASYANGKTALLKGSFSPTGFSATYTAPDGGTAAVEYSKTGDLLSGGKI